MDSYAVLAAALVFIPSLWYHVRVLEFMRDLVAGRDWYRRVVNVHFLKVKYATLSIICVLNSWLVVTAYASVLCTLSYLLLFYPF